MSEEIDVVYAIERFEDAVDEISSVCGKHYEEIAENKDVIKLDPYYEKYIDIDDGGGLLFVTARKDGRLIGYFIALIAPHLHYKSSLTAYTDIFYILEEYRHGRAGIKLIKYAMDEAKRRGVQRFYIGCKVKHALDGLFEKLGFSLIERHYSIVFKENDE